MRQTLRSFVQRVDFVTSVGYGSGPGTRQRLGLTSASPLKIVTDLGVLEPDAATREFVLTGLYPGVRVADAREGPAGTWPPRRNCTRWTRPRRPN